jgi:S1-C subfamily serine protease
LEDDMAANLEGLGFDVRRALDSVVSISAYVPDDAMTATLLGTERGGHGVVIRDDGLIVTIGYLIAEAESVFIGTGADRTVPAYVVGYDHETGFGLLCPTLPLERPAMPLGRAAELTVGEPVLVAGSAGEGSVVSARVAARQEFAGRWEYLLEEAIYTVPAHPEWAGAALVDRRGHLCGIGSLLVHDGESAEREAAANLFVPIDILLPVLDEICRYGRRRSRPRPWLGLLVHDDGSQLLVAGVYRNCPGDLAGIAPGDVIVALGGLPAGRLADFFRHLWSLGAAGIEVPLTVMRDGQLLELKIRTADRESFFRKGTIV